MCSLPLHALLLLASSGVDGLGDPLPPHAVARFGTTRLLHRGMVNATVFMPDGRQLITAASPESLVKTDTDDVRLWNADTGARVGEIRGMGNVTALSVTADGNTLALVSWDLGVVLWNMKINKEVRSIKPDDAYPTDGLITPDGQFVFATYPSVGVRKYQTSTGAPQGDLPLADVGHISLALSPNNQWLALGTEYGTVLLVSTATLSVLKRMDGLPGKVTAVAFSPDSRRVAYGTEKDAVGVFSLPELHPVFASTSSHGTGVDDVVFLKDGATLVSVGGRGPHVIYWDAAKGTQKHALGFGYDGALSVALSPEGTRLAVGMVEHKVHVLDVQTRKPAIPLPLIRGMVDSAVFLDESRVAVNTDEDGVLLFDPRTGKETRRLLDDVGAGALAHSRKAGIIALRDGYGALHIINDKTFADRKFEVDDLSSPLALSHDGTQVASGGFDGLIRYHTTTGKRLAKLPGHIKAQVDAVCYSATGALAVGLGLTTCKKAPPGGTMMIWRSLDAQPQVIKPLKEEVWSCAFTTDGKTLVASNHDGFVVVDVASGSVKKRVKEEMLLNITLSSDGKYVAGGNSSGHVVVWERSSGKEVFRANGHEHFTSHVVFSPDGRQLVSTGNDRQVLVWEFSP